MGQSISRPPTTAPTPTSTSTPVSEYANDTHTGRRSLPRRIFSSLPKPSLRSRPPSSLALPTRPEQTLRRKKRRWGLSRRHNVPANIEGTVSEPMSALEEHDEHQVDRDVDEFGVITHRVPDSHSDSQAPSAKGKEKAKEIFDIVDGNEYDNIPIPSSSTASPPSISGARADQIDDDQAIISPTDPPSFNPPPSPTVRDLERLLDPSPSVPPPLPMSQSLTQPTNASPRPFPPPGTLVVVQGVVHTTDVPRSSERPAVTSNPTPSTTNDTLNSNTNTGFEASSTRPTSLPPGTRSRNPLSGIFPRPTSMVSALPSSLPSDSTIDPSATDSQTRQATSNASGLIEENENEDRTHAHSHGTSMTQGPVGASGLSASSIDVLGTLLSVAAAATAASLLTGSSEPIFSSGLTSSQPPPSSDSVPQTAGFNPNVPSERPLSPTPTSDAGRMRHVWSSLRDRLGLGSGAHNSNHPHDTTSSSGPGQSVPSQTSDGGRPRDPREIMLAEMARAFNLGLGLGGATAGTPPIVATANSHTAEGGMLDNNDTLGSDRNGEQPPLPPPDSFERFLMDLQTDLRVTLMQEQDSGVLSGVPQHTQDTAEDVEEEDQRLPELQSLSDSDSEEFETRNSVSGDEDEPDCERDADEDIVEEDVHSAQEEPSGRASPAVSALGTGIHSPFGVRTRRESTCSFQASGTSALHTAPLQAMPTPVSSSTTDNREDQNIRAPHASPSAVGIGTYAPMSDSSPSEMRSEEGPEGAVSGVAHSPGASNGERRVEVEGARARALSGGIAVAPHIAQDASNVLGTGIRQESLLSGTSSLSVPLMSSTPNLPQIGSAITTQDATQPSAWTLPLSSGPERTIRNSSFPNPTSVDSPMPFRLPLTPSSASRTEHTPGGGINWWRMYRFPAVTSPNLGQPGSQGSLPLSQSPFRSPAEGPSHSPNSSWARTADQNRQNEIFMPRGVTEVPGVHSGLAAPALTPIATSANIPELVSTPSESSRTPLHTNGQDSNASTEIPEHRSNVVVPVIVVGLQSVNMDRQPPHMPHPHPNHATTMDDEDGEGMDFDGLEQTMSMPLHVPEPAEFRHHPNTTQQEQSGQQPARGRTWQSRAANAIRNLRPSRRNADTTNPQPQETPGSRTFLIYVIGGYYPPDHQIITGENLDSFEALWELAELLGQVKPPTVSKEEIERSGLEIVKASMLGEYEKQGLVASNCIDRCLICLDDYNPEDELRLLTCKHAFHQGCVDRWLETGRNNCPACRTKGVANQDA